MDAAANTQSAVEQGPDEPIAAWVAGIALIACIALLVTGVVTGLGIMGTIGFFVIIPGVLGSAVGAVVNAARRTSS